jgi:hypothetical protein
MGIPFSGKSLIRRTVLTRSAMHSSPMMISISLVALISNSIFGRFRIKWPPSWAKSINKKSLRWMKSFKWRWRIKSTMWNSLPTFGFSLLFTRIKRILCSFGTLRRSRRYNKKEILLSCLMWNWTIAMKLFRINSGRVRESLLLLCQPLRQYWHSAWIMW